MAALDDAPQGGQTAQRVTIGAAAVLALLTVLGTILNKLPLRTLVLCLGLALLAVLTVLVNAGFATRGRKIATRDQATRLRQLLSSWPLRKPGDISAYSIGVRSPAASVTSGQLFPRYVERDIDEQVHEALALATVVLLVGPPCAGKSRTAFEALMKSGRTEDGGVIAPDDGTALAELLAHPDWVTDPGQHYVLWLDDLERYLGDVRLRMLDAFIRTADPHRHNAQDVSGVVVVATLRDDVLQTIFADGGDRAHVLRGFIARAERIMVPAQLSADELARLAEAYPNAPKGESFAEVFGATMLQLGHPLYTPPLPAPASGRRRPSLSPVGAVALLVSLAVLLVIVGQRNGWMNPAPLSDRFNALSARDDACGGSGLSPTTSGAVRSDVVRVIHKGDGCPESDVVEVYPRDGATLAAHRAFALQAGAEQKASFRCLGPDRADPCHPDVFGGKRVIVGEWVDPVSLERIPVAIYSSRDTYVPVAIDVPEPTAVAQSSSTSPALARRTRTLAVSDRETGRSWVLEGSPVQEAVMLPPRGDRGATLLAAYTTGRRLNRPELLGRAFELRLKDGRVAVGSVCRGKQAHVLRFAVNENTNVAQALKQRWVRAATSGRVTCDAA